MLENHTKKLLRQHNLLDLLKKDSNPYGRIKRLRDQSSRALDELALLAMNFPKDSHTQVFTYTAVDKLLDAILYGNPQDNTDDNNGDFEGKMTHIASMLVRKGVNYCLNKYISRIEQNSALNKATTKELNEAIEICDAIAFKIYSSQLEALAKVRNMKYLFNWNKIKEIRINSIDSDSAAINNDIRNLIEFLVDELTELQGKKLGQLREIKIESKGGTSEMKNGFVCYLVTRFGTGFRCHLQINKDYKSLDITFYDEDYSSPLITRNLVVNREVGNYYIYDKMKPIVKKSK
jgi:hypothetical protein